MNCTRTVQFQAGFKAVKSAKRLETIAASQKRFKKRPNIRFGSVRFGDSVFFRRFGSVRFEWRSSRNRPTQVNNQPRSRDWLSANQGPVFPDILPVQHYSQHDHSRYHTGCGHNTKLHPSVSLCQHLSCHPSWLFDYTSGTEIPQHNILH
eukprot:sb/3473575/